MNKNEIKQFCIQLIEEAEVAYLITVDSNAVPYTRAMFNLRNVEQFPSLSKLFINHQDDLLVYFSTNTSSSKVEQIKKNPAVSVYYSKPKEFRGVMLGGLLEIVTDQKIKEELWLDGWEIYYPEGVEDPDYTVLRLLPKFVRGWAKDKAFALGLK